MHSIAFQIGGFSIYWYGILTAAGFLAAFWTASKRAPLIGISSETVSDLAPWLIVGAVAGARLLYVISYWKEEFASAPIWEIFMLRRSGLVFYGGLIGASLATYAYAWRKGLPIWRLADVFAPSIALGHAFGRLGCLMTGCCYGRACDYPWAIRFPQDHWTAGAPVHPTQIYEAILNFGLYLGLARLFRRRRFDGQVFALYLVCYAVLRAFVEVFRGDYPQRYFGGLLTPAHLVSAGILAAGLGLYWRLRRFKTSPAQRAQ